MKKLLKKIDLTGQRFGNLTVIEIAYETKSDTKWLCQCDCGLKIDVEARKLLNGTTTTCDSKTCAFNRNKRNQKLPSLKASIQRYRFVIAKSKLKKIDGSFNNIL